MFKGIAAIGTAQDRPPARQQATDVFHFQFVGLAGGQQAFEPFINTDDFPTIVDHRVFDHRAEDSI